MKKIDIKEYFGTFTKAATALGYAHKQSIFRLPETLIPRQEAQVKMRMKANGLEIPGHW